MPRCQTIPAGALGEACVDDSSCGLATGRRCFKGAVPKPSGSRRTAVCLEVTTLDGGCSTSGATVGEFGLALDAGAVFLCTTPGLLTTCSRNEQCKGGQVCTLFDNEKVGPIGVCDDPLAGGAGADEACVVQPSSSGKLCETGLCRPPAPLPNSTCGALCERGSCPSGRQCALVEFGHVGVIRHVPMCVPQVTATCQACSDASPCGADMPHCEPVGVKSVCLAACTAGTKSFPDCPPGFVCRSLSSGDRCLPALPDGGVGCP